MILDTNAVSALLAGERRASDAAQRPPRFTLPFVVVAEFEFGLQTSTQKRRLEALFRKLESESDVLYPDRESVASYVRTRAELKRLGKPIPEGDLWIAALARQHGLEVLSRDEHFDAVPGVRRVAF